MSGRGLALLALLVAACTAYLVLGATRGTAEYYRTIAEARTDIANSADVRVLGTVQPGVRWLDGGQEVRFTAAQGGASMPVDYRGPVPDIFKPGIQVVLEGHLDPNGVFEASTLLAKCPSRFASGRPGSGP